MAVAFERRGIALPVAIDRRVTSPMPEAVTRITLPARGYLLVMALRFGTVGGLALLGPADLVATPVLQHPLSPGVWGAVFCIMAALGVVGAVMGTERLFRSLILLSFFLTAATAARLGVGLAEGDLRFVLAPVFATTLALKDMVVSAMQVTAPLGGMLPEAT